MSTYTLEDIRTSTDRHKLYILLCSPTSLSACVHSLQSQKISVVNIGKELALFIDSINDSAYLHIEAHNFILKLLEAQKSKINEASNEVVALYNLGILLEPDLEINAVQLLKDLSKSTGLIILWEHQSELPNKLFWPTQKNTYLFDFTDTALKELQYAI